MKTNSCSYTPINPKKYSYKEFDNKKKKFLRHENPPPLHNFSNGPSLMLRASLWYKLYYLTCYLTHNFVIARE